jgi:hypothetical protein
MKRSKSWIAAACLGMMVLSACGDGPVEPAAVPERQEHAPSAVATQIAPADLIGTVAYHGRSGRDERRIDVTRADLAAPAIEVDREELEEAVRSLGREGSERARTARLLAFGTAAEKRAAAAPFASGIALHPTAHSTGGSVVGGEIRRGNRSWITWALAAPLGGAGLGPQAMEGVGQPTGAEIARSGGCLDCGGIEEDYDPYYDPTPAVTEAAAATAFVMDLEATAYAGETPEECYGYRAAFAVSLSTTISAAAITTIAAFAKMPVTTYKYGTMTASGVFATYVAWEFLESCKKQFRKK